MSVTSHVRYASRPVPEPAQPVYNEQNQRVGTIDDLVIAPGSAVSCGIIGAGGFVGLGRHDVLIPVEQLKQQDNKVRAARRDQRSDQGAPEVRIR
jgi:hypothetical protein